MIKSKSLVVVCAFLAAWCASVVPAQAAVAQQVQSGTVTNTSNGTQVVAISSVVMSKSVLFFSTRHSGDRPVSSLIRGRLASATTIEFVRVTNEGGPVAIDIQWYLVSFGTGVNVQRGEVAQTATTLNVTIAAVASLSQAFVLYSKTPTASDLTWGDDDPILGELTSTTNLQFRPTTATATHTIAWQVVEFTDPADINVQRGSVAMTGGALTATATLTTPVNLMKTFVLAGFRATGSDDNVGSRMVRARLTSPTTIEFDRGVAGSADLPEIVWQAVEFRDNTNVYSGSSNLAIGQSSDATLLTTASRINTSRAVAFGSVQAGAGQNMGSTAYAASDVTGVASATASLGIGFRSSTSGRATSGSLTINMPAGTLEGDVLIAGFGIAGNNVAATPPTGWTLIRRTNRTTTNSTLTYWKLATDSEPASYTWTLAGNNGSAGGILSFVGVDAVDPIDVDNGAATASSVNHTAPSVTTTAPNEMIVTVHSYRSSNTWTPPAGMTEAVDVASSATVPNNNGQATEINYVMQSAAGATGTNTAVAGGNNDTGATQTLALRASRAASHINIIRNSTVSAADIGWFVVEFDRGGGFETGSFVKKNNGTGTQVIPHGLGETPKAMILWTVGRNDENFGDHHWSSIGFTNGTAHYAAGTYARAGTTNVGRRMVNNRVLTLLECAPTCAVEAEANFASWDDSGITLDWTTNDADANVVHYVLISGADVQANVVNWQTRDSTGNLTVNGVGFQPDGVFSVHIGSGYTVALGTNNTTSALGLGLMTRSSARQWAWGYVSGGGQARRGQATDGMLMTHDTGGTVTKKASFVSMDADGFTVNFGTSTSGNQAQVMSLALKGLNIDAGSFLKSTASQPASQAVTGVGFVPSLAMLTSFQDTTLGSADVDGRYGLGASDGTREGSVAVADVSGATRVRSIDKTSKVFMKVNSDPAAIDAEALMTSLDPDGFTLNWTTNDAQATQILYAAMAPIHTTEVRLLSFDAARYNRGVLLGWRTGYEVDNLGFHVFREIGGQRTRVNAALVAGSGLSSARGAAVRREQAYALWDLDAAAADETATYWLVDVDMNGATTWHGPVTAIDATGPVPETSSSEALHDVGRSLDRNVFVTRGEEADASRAAANRSGRLVASLEAEFTVAQTLALKIGIRAAGWYRVPQNEIALAGFNTAVDPRTLRMFMNGAEQAIRVNGEEDGQFDSADSVEFYATGVDTPYTDTRVYWLAAGTGNGARIQTAAAPGAGPVAGPANFVSILQQKERSIFFAGLKNGETENWFGALISESATDLPLTVNRVDAGAVEPAQLEISLQGVTSVPSVDPDHRVAVLLNGTELGEMVFDGTDLHAQTFAVPAGVLVEGGNILRLVSRAGDSDFTLVDVIRLSYAHTYDAENDALRFTVGTPGPVTIDGFTGPGIRVVDVTDPVAPSELAGIASDNGTAFALTVDVQGAGTRTLVAFRPATIAAAASLRLNEPSQWRSASLAHDYVMVVHPDFAAAVAPLVALRAEQGHAPAVVRIEDIYDEFSFGQKTPRAMKDFLTWARANWSVAPRWIVLVGDATTDPRNYAGLGDADFVPTRLVPMDGIALESASDDWFVDADDDGLTEMAIGRLPVRTLAHAHTMVAKIVDYERAPAGPWTKSVLFVADRSDPAADFSANATRLAAQLPPEYQAQMILRDEMDLADARQALTSGVNAGQVFVNYDGHGSVNLWSGNNLTGELLTRSDVRDTWLNAARLPVAVLMNCLNGLFNGYFDEESLAETLLRSPAGGAVAAWASSSVTPSATQSLVNEEFYRLVFHGVYGTVGEAAAASKRVVTNADLRRSWIFFGDPAMRLSGLVTHVNPVLPPGPPAAAAISVHPVHQIVSGVTPEPGSFSCSGTGQDLQFRWEFAAGMSDWIPMPGAFISSSATSSTLTVPAGQAVHFGLYRCTVENASGAMTSDAAAYVNARLVATPGSLQFVRRTDQTGTPAATPSQRVTVNVRGPLSQWTAVASEPWVHITNAAGSGPGVFTVSIDAATAPAGNGTASVTVFEASVPVTVVLPVTYAVETGDPSAPFGFVDAPLHNATVSGAIAVTGWALDDIGVQRVEIWRSCTAAEQNGGGCTTSPYGGPDLVFVGTAAFVAGARPDVETTFATLPRAGRAGWGLMVLTNAFPHIPNGGVGGQGAFELYTYAVDEEGIAALIGIRPITVDNDNATVPFGTIDTPSPGEATTTPVLVNFGWAMTQAGKCIDTASDTAYQVFIDGIARPLRPSGMAQNWYPALHRPDLAAQFPGLCNTGNALAAYYIDVADLGLSPGQHTIAWVVTDDAGNAAGIGSRFFEILFDPSNESGVLEAPPAASSVASLRPSARTVRVQTGFDDNAVWTRTRKDADGHHQLSLPTGGRIVLDLGGAVAAGYEVVGGDLRPLPSGATLDLATGRFAWQPPVGFFGAFRLAFTRGSERVDVIATVGDPAATPRDNRQE